MSPQIIETKLPQGHKLVPRQTCFAPVDERPTWRDEHGRVRAVVEQWAAEWVN